MQLFDHLTVVNLSYFDSHSFDTSLEDPKLLFIGPLSGQIDAEIQTIQSKLELASKLDLW